MTGGRRARLLRLFIDPPFKKSPSKSSESIRAKLESSHWKSAKDSAPGPLVDGLAPDARLVIATFRTAEAGRRFQQVLLQAGVMSAGRFHRHGAEISVDCSNRQKAATLLDEHQRQFPDLAPAIERKDFDFTICGTVLGATFGVIILSAELLTLRDFLVTAIFTLFGAVSGRFIDRPRNRYRTTGQLQFGIGDLMVLTAAVGLGIVLWRLMGGK